MSLFEWTIVYVTFDFLKFCFGVYHVLLQVAFSIFIIEVWFFFFWKWKSMRICWIIKQLSCSILRNIPWFSQLGLRPRWLSIRRYSARFRRIIVKYPARPHRIIVNYNTTLKFWSAPIGRNRSREVKVSLFSGFLSARSARFWQFLHKIQHCTIKTIESLSQALCVIGSLGNLMFKLHISPRTTFCGSYLLWTSNFLGQPITR